MKHSLPINTNQYWNSRFATDWGSYDGPKQSRFFSQIAINQLPDWILTQIRKESLTLADWGCAEGDGTDVWASFIDASQLTGIDFSTVAIDTAKMRYPSIQFNSADWLSTKEENLDRFDIVFSSNTLEHFHKPYDIIDSLCKHARNALILALPYRETDRISEHFYSFLPENIPLVLPNDFKLVWSRVQDCRPIPNSCWNGEQIILIFADLNWSADLAQTLKSCSIQQDDLDTKIKQLIATQLENEKKINKLEQSVGERQSALEKAQLILESSRQKSTKCHQDHRQQMDFQLQQQNKLQKQHDTLQEQHDYMEEQNQALEIQHCSLQEQRDSLQHQHNHLCELHAKERHTIVKPVLRLGYRSALKVAKKLPIPIKNQLRQLTRHLPISRPLATNGLQPMQSGNQHEDSANNPWLNSILDAKSNLPDIILFPVIDWHFRVQRPQHLSRELANLGHRVFYLTTTFQHARTARAQVLESPASNVFIVQLAVPTPHPNIYTTVMDDSTANHIQDAIEQMYQAFNIGPAVALIDLPFWRKSTNHLPATIQIYDCMDHHAGFSTNEGGIQEKEEQALLQSADVVISSSVRLQEKLSMQAESVLIRNAAEISIFKQPPESLPYTSEKPVVGYYGAISDWFDMELLVRAAKRFPDWEFVLIGAVTHPSPRIAQALKNVTFIGEITYTELPGYLHAFDICTIPFLINELTLCTNPVKIYEYLAAGKPVVTTDMPELRLIDDICHVKDSHESFLDGLQQAMAETDDQKLAQARTKWALQHDWEHRAKILHQAITNAWPKVSVIILTYNNLDFTKACLESVEKHTKYPNLELIIVDNASTDDTPRFLQKYTIEHPDVTVILNQENLGFSAGNNVGLRIASGDFLVILNNDTYVTDGWLHGLIRHFKRNKELGLVGPVTNNIGNEAKIDTQYENMADMLSESRVYTRKNSDNLLYVENVAFFCVALSRDAYRKIGDMDEDFILGFFEDDDYCRRASEQGFQIAIANDVFIHHHLSASFNKLGEKRKQEIFLANKAVYEKKWGKWEPHEHR